MSKITGLVLFIMGVTIGTVGTRYYLKNKYEQIAQEEIDSVKEKFLEKSKSKVSSEDEKTDDKSSIKIPNDIEKVYKNYANVSNIDKSSIHPDCIQEDTFRGNKPYVIPPDEFGEQDDYDCISLTYYADETLADDCDEPITDIESIIGKKSLTMFGEYEDDCVFVRNDKLKCDYEITLDERCYTDVIESNLI